MKPAFSLIVFTVASGTGLGLLLWVLYAQASAGLDPRGPAGVAAALLITAGLLASTAHLANPRNAWRAFSRFGSSWLSREGVLAVLLYPVALLHLWVSAQVPATSSGLSTLTGLLLGVLAIAVVLSTAMIYACLKTVPRWRTWHTPARFLALALAAGLFCARALEPAAFVTPGLTTLAMLLVLLVLAIDALQTLKFSSYRLATANDALGVQGRVRLFDVGHSQRTFLTDEFGFVLARDKARLLRLLAWVLWAGVPVPLLLAAAAAGSAAVSAAGSGSALGPVLAVLAAVSFVAGTLVERWLFYAQAEHVVRLYHGQSEV